MHTSGANHPWRRGWVLGLVLLSLAVPLAAVFLRSEPLVPFDDPARLSYSRWAVAYPWAGLCRGGLRRPADAGSDLGSPAERGPGESRPGDWRILALDPDWDLRAAGRLGAV